MSRLSLTACSALLLTLWGCGGSGGNGAAPVVQHATFQISWPARSRGVFVNPLTSALSVQVVLKNAASNGANVTMDIDRDTTQVAGYTGTYTVQQPIRPSSGTMNATFYAQAGETGAVVGTATVLSAEQGSAISFGTVSLNGVIATVSVVPATLTLDTPASQLQFACADAHGTAVAVSPGSAMWAISSNPAFLTLTPDGIATPVTNGTANVTATVDGITSPAQGIIVVHAPDFQNPGFESPAIASGSFNEAANAATGWTGASVIAGDGVGFGIANGNGEWGVGAESGSQYAFLQSTESTDTNQGTCAQTITGLIPGTSYKVTFWMARRDGSVGGNTGEPISVTANGESIFLPTAPTTDALWNENETSTFTATQSSYTFVFSTQPPATGQDQSTLLDEVHLVPVK